jgi:UTP--glucose-1-phosphate uridylyltransferase
VPRSRFAPVKTTGDLFALRSDAYEVLDNGQVLLAPERHGEPPVVTLGDSYKLVDQLDELGVPGLLNCHSLTLDGRVHFAEGVRLAGDVIIHGGQENPKSLTAGDYQDAEISL